MFDYLRRLLAGMRTQTTLPRVLRTPAPTVEPWREDGDGMRYVHNKWVAIDDDTVEWTGDSRPIQNEGIANPNHTEFGKTVNVPAGKTRMRVSAVATVTSNDPLAGGEPVTGTIRVWVDGVSFLADDVSCYRAPITENKTVSKELVAYGDVSPGGKATIYLTGYSPAGGFIRFDNIAYSFS